MLRLTVTAQVPVLIKKKIISYPKDSVRDILPQIALALNCLETGLSVESPLFQQRGVSALLYISLITQRADSL
jgi:hypothetical protein